MNYANVLVRNYPGTRWKMKNSSDYDTLEWYDESSKPSKDDLDAKLIELENAEPMRLLRVERDAKLAACDWRASSDVTLADAWKTYRQALRDLPASANPTVDSNGQLNLSSVTFPTEPS